MAKDYKKACRVFNDNPKMHGHWLDEVWVQSDCKCEYCGIDLLVGAAVFRAQEGDHILPQAKYKGLSNALANFAMACASCHKLKHKSNPQFDPALGEPRWSGLSDLTEEDRTLLIRRVQEYLKDLREKQDIALSRCSKIS